VSLLATLPLKRGTYVITLHPENTVSMDVTFFEQQSYFSSTPTPLQGESQIEEDFLTLLPILTPMQEPKQQQVTNESPTEPTDQPSAPPVEELRVYSRCQKAKAIPDDAKYLIRAQVLLLHVLLRLLLI
jgi:hypothetical protein